MRTVVVGARLASARDIVDARHLPEAGTVTLVAEHGVITGIHPTGSPPPGGDAVIDAAGLLALPGMHDHHLHLLATAAALASVDCSPAAVRARGSLTALLADADAQITEGRGTKARWLRGVGFEETGAVVLDRHALDAAVPHRPVRVQHRSGAMWVLNSLALGLLPPLPHSADVERDATGRPTGRLFRLDALVGAAAGREAPDIAAVGALLSSYGVTGVTDATPDLDDDTIALLDRATLDGAVPQAVTLLGAPLPGHDRIEPWRGPGRGRLRAGPWKIHLHDHDLPAFDDLAAEVAHAHDAGRPVAVHCVTRESLILTLAALQDRGPLPGDRIEHASVVPPEVNDWMYTLGVRVITQPGFVAERGDHYLTSVDPVDRPHLYRYRSLLAAGIPVAPSSDAPYTSPNPWAAVEAASTRTAPSGAVLSPAESVPAAVALDGYLSAADDPGGAVRTLAVGAPADLCLVHPANDGGPPEVCMTLAAGVVVHAG